MERALFDQVYLSMEDLILKILLDPDEVKEAPHRAARFKLYENIDVAGQIRAGGQPLRSVAAEESAFA